MIVRLVLAVVVATALLAAAMPVVDDARHEVRATAADRSVQTIADAITDVSRSSDSVPRGTPGARRVVSVEVPSEATVTIGGNATDNGQDAARAAISYRVPPNTTGRTTVGVDVRVVEGTAVRPAGAVLVLRESHRVVLRYELVDGDPAVTVESVYPG
ncbi:DUF7311 family protein [Halanaeroarchaeum sulfurireducens]|uniref:DUF7311 domain-containing protein n=1 Tax=Halanaeroarchaeum sulfurireducens TaxID=1604004 RepID=A0A0F7PBR8_9EURY|nr:hypothetical protein [Halanaeroarchaeum sulfurireducens]AKH97089.1 hypothetical protein HLASF_0593 [Halanaeroarchaeum sulfurireducens]ALG81490.1 hypothetical protein HLASA_0589 [Halanaeroarchaeum sulfurireducens]